MNIAIIGAPERAIAWEKHIAEHRIIDEITITSTIEAITSTDACLIADESSQNMALVEYAVKMGWHCFLIAPIPTDKKQVLKITRFAEEAGVVVQFMHWPTLSHATKWMMNQMPKPDILTIRRELTRLEFSEQNSTLKSLWVDELALCLRWIDSGIRHLDVNRFTTEKNIQAGVLFDLFIRFNNGATASIFIHTTAGKNQHQRIATSSDLLLDCNVTTQNIHVHHYKTEAHQPVVDIKKFNPAKSASFAVTQFLKAIQTGTSASYNPHHAYQLCKAIECIESSL